MLLHLLLSSALTQAPTCPVAAPWSTAMLPSGPISANPMSNMVGEHDGVLRWNGNPVSAGQLRTYVRLTGTLRPRPIMVLNTRGLSCGRLAELQRMVEEAAPCSPTLCRAVWLPPSAEPQPGPPPPPPPGPPVRR